MIKYKLLKDLPFAKAGTLFTRNTFKSKDGLSDYDYLETSILLDGNQDETVFGIKRNYFINNFDEWFEKIKEPEKIFTIDTINAKVKETLRVFYSETVIENLEKLGLSFETRKQAEEYLEYLKAKQVIKQDTKGFKFNWTSRNQNKLYGYWDYERNQANYFREDTRRHSDIYFYSKEDIEESLKNHPKEWKTYLTYEQ